jgi:hypothetical protein
VGKLLARIAALAGVAAIATYLRSPSGRRRTPEGQAGLERAVARVDRELAADLELMAMFDQTKQAFVLENGEFLAARETIEREAPEAFVSVADLYHRIPATEAAMERRGPAGSIADADLALIHAWEGDAREAQRTLRASLVVDRSPRWRALAARLRARFTTH